MLAYVFWHRYAPDVSVDDYEAALVRFQQSLRRAPPGGFITAACLRAIALPWLGEGGAGYEDWYLVEDYAALGVINEAAVGRGHLTAHEAVARLMGEGTGGLYRLLDGEPRLEQARLATWITPTHGPTEALIEDFLVDGVQADGASLWRRQLSLGPAPELCLLAGELPAGAHSTRLAEGWRVQTDVRAAL